MAGKIAEDGAPERARRLAATLPAYLNALAGKGVHIVTVNDYLAARDADWMGKVYRFLGLSVGVILSQQATEEKTRRLRAPTSRTAPQRVRVRLFGANNMNTRWPTGGQRGLFYGIVDEVDSILIDDGAHAADHLRPSRRSHRNVCGVSTRSPKLLSRQADEKGEGELLGRRESAPSAHLGRRSREAGGNIDAHGNAGRRREFVFAVQHHPDASPERCAACDIR
jgi:preprotein translocase subunit SecA